MTISFVASALGNDATTSSTSTAVPFTLPTVLDDDFAIATMQYNATASDITTPTGWTKLTGSPFTTTSHSAWAFYKKLTAAESATVVSFPLATGSGRLVGLMDIFRGVDPTTPLDATPVHSLIGTGTTPAAPAITSVTDDAWIYNAWLVKTTSGGPPGPTLAVPGTHTARGFSSTNIASGAQHSCRGGTLTTPGAAGAYGPYTATAGFSEISAHTFSFALMPLAAAGGGVAVPYGTALQKALNLKAGTTGLAAQAAANAWAGTTGMSLQAALNDLAGTTGLPLQAVLNELAGTSGLGVQAAIAAITAV